jgi:hypothetical protein
MMCYRSWASQSPAHRQETRTSSHRFGVLWGNIRFPVIENLEKNSTGWMDLPQNDDLTYASLSSEAADREAVIGLATDVTASDTPCP